MALFHCGGDPLGPLALHLFSPLSVRVLTSKRISKVRNLANSSGKLDALSIGAGVAFAMMWASAFTSARVIVHYAPPLTTLSVRFLVSGLLGVGLAWALGQSWRLTRRQWFATAIFGLCQNALYLGLNFVAMQSVEASLAAIIASSMPLIVAIAGWGLSSERLGWFGAA